MLSKEIKLSEEVSIVSYPGWKFKFSEKLNNENKDSIILKYKDNLFYINNLYLENKLSKINNNILIDRLLPLIKPKMILKDRVEKYYMLMKENEWDWSKTIASLVKENNKFRLIDGAHRLLAAKKTGISVVRYNDFTDIILTEFKNAININFYTTTIHRF